MSVIQKTALIRVYSREEFAHKRPRAARKTCMITEGGSASHPQVGLSFDVTCGWTFYCKEGTVLQWRMERTITGEDLLSPVIKGNFQSVMNQLVPPSY